MIVCFDATALMYLLDQNRTSHQEEDGTVVQHMPLRMRHLVDSIDQASGRVVVPTPALAELLVGAGTQRGAMIRALENRRVFRVASFNRLAAIECALLDAGAVADGDKKDGVRSAWQKVKIDRQILAIAKVHGCDRIVTGDRDVVALAGRAAIAAQRVTELPLPPEDPQQDLFESEAADPGREG